MEADNGIFGLRMFRNQLEVAWSTNLSLPDFNFCLLTVVPFFTASKSFSLFLTQVNKVFIGTSSVAFSFLQIFKCLAFFTKCFVGVFSFSCHQNFKNEQYHNMKKKQAKEHTPVFSQDSAKALKHSNISTFDSSIQKVEHFIIWTLVITYIMKALWIKSGTMSVHLRR